MTQEQHKPVKASVVERCFLLASDPGSNQCGGGSPSKRKTFV